MPCEYRVLYTIDGKGFVDDIPWVEIETNVVEEARQAYYDLLTWFREHDENTQIQVWIEVRSINPWSRVDVDNLV
jgi:hypothetical protein